MNHPTIIAAAGPPLAEGGSRRRPVGRIGGIAGPASEETRARLGAALGPGAQVLRASGVGLVADYDGCFLDGRPIASLDEWRAAIASGRLAAVEGAFALAWRDAEDNLRLARDG